VDIQVENRNRFEPGRLLLTLAVLFSTALVAHAAVNPNIEGVWKLEPPHAALVPERGEIPFTDQGRKEYDDNKASAAKGDYSFDRTETRCSSPGLPRLMLTPKLIKIYRRPQMVAILFEWNRLLRQIDLRQGAQKLPNPMEEGVSTGGGDVGTAKGETTGKWEGDVLIAHSSKFSDQKLLDEFIPNSEDLELTEHIRLKDRNTLEDRITIQDPQYFTRPWDTVLIYKRQPEALFPFHEDVCLDRKSAGELPLPR